MVLRTVFKYIKCWFVNNDGIMKYISYQVENISKDNVNFTQGNV